METVNAVPVFYSVLPLVLLPLLPFSFFLAFAYDKFILCRFADDLHVSTCISSSVLHVILPVLRVFTMFFSLSILICRYSLIYGTFTVLFYGTSTPFLHETHKYVVTYVDEVFSSLRSLFPRS